MDFKLLNMLNMLGVLGLLFVILARLGEIARLLADIRDGANDIERMRSRLRALKESE